MAQWVDLGFRSVDYLNGIAARFVDVRRGQMSFAITCTSGWSRGIWHFLLKTPATSIFNFVLQTETTILEPYLVVVAHFWKCRAHRGSRIEPALHHIREAKKAGPRNEGRPAGRGYQRSRNWLLFQRGGRREAIRLLDLAETSSNQRARSVPGEHESARGRFVRRSGEYAKALAHFERAVALYSSAFADHPTWPVPWSMLLTLSD